MGVKRKWSWEKIMMYTLMFVVYTSIIGIVVQGANGAGHYATKYNVVDAELQQLKQEFKVYKSRRWYKHLFR